MYAIHRALIMQPEFIIADEPISALDVSIQAHIINLLKDIQKNRNLTMLFIAHDLPMVRYIADRIAVMYLGKIVEMAEADELCHNPKHPYTQALLAAIPIPEPGKSVGEDKMLNGEPPSATDHFDGCSFYSRCPYAKDICKTMKPEMTEYCNDHFVACHFCRGDRI